MAKRILRRPAATAEAGEPAAAKPKPPLPPPDPHPSAGNGVSHAHSPPAVAIRDEQVPISASSVDSRRTSNGGAYHTKCFLEIYGSLKPDGSHLIFIDGKRIKIDWLQFILLLILASHARSKAGLDSPMDLRGGDYLQPARIEEIIHQLKNGSLLCGGRPLPECQNAYSADLLRNAKYDLRLRVQRKSENPNLLDRGDGAGYRISTPPSRIKITLLIEGADDLVFDWQE